MLNTNHFNVSHNYKARITALEVVNAQCMYFQPNNFIAEGSCRSQQQLFLVWKLYFIYYLSTNHRFFTCCTTDISFHNLARLPQLFFCIGKRYRYSREKVAVAAHVQIDLNRHRYSLKLVFFPYHPRHISWDEPRLGAISSGFKDNHFNIVLVALVIFWAQCVMYLRQNF